MTKSFSASRVSPADDPELLEDNEAVLQNLGMHITQGAKSSDIDDEEEEENDVEEDESTNEPVSESSELDEAILGVDDRLELERLEREVQEEGALLEFENEEEEDI